VHRILIVDDEAAIRSLLAIAFEKAGYDVRTAPDGPEALALCAAESFDAVLSDVVMPRMNGHDLARWIAARHPRTRLVLMSGFDLGCQNCPSAPRCQFLPKPFRLAEALSLVRNALAEPSAN
jgi:DNA-binding NtrC family response regulator